MRRIVGILCVASSLVTPVAAQVINGEGIYEDSFAHRPPESAGETSRVRDAARPANPSAASPRDGRERDRDP